MADPGSPDQQGTQRARSGNPLPGNWRAYRDAVNALADDYPHFNVLLSGFYFEKGSLMRVDFPSKQMADFDVQFDTHQREVVDFLKEGLSDVTTRVIMVEDLSNNIFQALGSTFSLSPEFFTEHLHEQVPGREKVEGPYMGEWAAWNIKKPYMSVRWYRPVIRNEEVAASAAARKEIEETRIRRTRIRPVKRGNTPVEEEVEISIHRPGSNIFRSEWDILLGSKSVSARFASVEERITVYRTMYGDSNISEFYLQLLHFPPKHGIVEVWSKGTRRIVLVLLDPLPSSWKATWSIQSTSSTSPPLPTPPDNVLEQWQREEPANPHYPKTTLLYNSLVPRFLPTARYEEIVNPDTPDFRAQFTQMHSTLLTLGKHFFCYFLGDFQSDAEPQVLAFWFISRIVSIDTLGLLHLLDEILDTLGRSVVLQSQDLEHLHTQRALITQLQSQLPALGRSIVRCLKNLQSFSQGHWGDISANKDMDSQDPTVGEITANFAIIEQRLAQAATILVANLQFLESHRAIAEAESVTKLTELAFFFIPLSFAASAFSMQIRELNQPVPVSFFVTFALSLLAFSYLLRVLVRSEFIHRHKRALLASVRKHQALPPDASIPNSAFLTWLYVKGGPGFILTFFFLAILVPSLAILWTRETGNGLKAAVTVVLFVFIAIFGALLLSAEEIRWRVLYGFKHSWLMDRSIQVEGKTPGWFGRIWRRLVGSIQSRYFKKVSNEVSEP